MKKDRRNFFKGTATLGATALFPAPAIAIPKADNRVIASDARTVVDTAGGRLRGVERRGIYVFKGVPYGDSTAGANRFLAPQPVKPWRGIRNALRFGRACIQPGSDSAHFNYDGHNNPGDEIGFLMHTAAAKLTPGEDCLQLNVWTPVLKDSRKRPVMVFYHGGGFESGFDGDLASYDGENLARNDVVVVTNNHRLNLFGYLNLVEAGSSRATANAGLLDLVAVLQWVRDNIAQFGGDPGNVTIFGQSGGGGKVLCLMAMPSAKGLFHRAIVQSGPYLKFQTREASRAITEDVMRQLGVARGDLDSLQQVPVDRLAGAGAEAMKRAVPPRPVFRRTFGEVGWQPVVDGVVLPHDPFAPDAPMVSAGVPMMTGTIFNEITSALADPVGAAMTERQLQQGVGEAYGAKGPAIIAAYRKTWPAATPFELYAAIAAHPFRYAAHKQAARKAQLGAAPSFVYLYKWRTPMLDDRPGTFHACDLPFTFDNAVRCDQYSGLRPEALAMARKIAGAWVAFARHGDPNHPGLPHWPAHAGDAGATMVFDNICEARNGVEAEGLEMVSAA
jgi:para-nitrobenzyl esterase